MVTCYPEWQVIQAEEKTTHVHPLGFGHAIEGRTCWCDPEIEQLCLICLRQEDAKSKCLGCCGSGLVPVFTDNPEWPTVVVHKDMSLARLN